MPRAYLFPGQGSQTVGMGKDLAEQFPVARAVFDEVDAALGRSLSHIMWEGPSQTLVETANAQPALMAHSIAVLRVLEAEKGLDISRAAFVAGHSLGEYSALCAAGAISLQEAARLLRARGEAMQEAAAATNGAMAALIGVDIDGAQAAIDGSGQAENAVIANDNAPGQIVVSGTIDAITAVCASAKDFGVRIAKKLAVSGAFHSPLMDAAADTMAPVLTGATLSESRPQIVLNTTAEPTDDPEIIRVQLLKQLTGRVRWRESVLNMWTGGVDEFYELGSGAVLTGLTRRIAKAASAISVGSVEDVQKFAV
ncbi:MAG: ACP S-malonyltransferase [Pseudomonadota bacterium]